MRLGRVYRSERYPLRGGWPGYGWTLVVVGLIVMFKNGELGGVSVGATLIALGLNKP